MIWMKYRSGLNSVIFCAQPGMLLIGVNSPLIRISTIMKKNITNIACCIVSEVFDTSRPRPDTVSTYSAIPA